MVISTAFLGLAQNFKTAVGLPVVLGLVSGSGTRNVVRTQWYKNLRTPPGRPPPQVFPLIWTLLYLSIGYASYVAAKTLDDPSASQTAKAQVRIGLGLFYAQLALNFAWSPLFFGMRKIGLALVDSILLTVTSWCMLAILHSPTNSSTTLFLAPCCIWLSFATYLNAGIWLLN